MQWKPVAGLIADTSLYQSMFNFLNMLKFSKSEIGAMADRTLSRHKKQIQSGYDANGKSFDEYADHYAARKKNMYYAKRGQISAQTDPVNLTLTGKMLKAFQVLKADYKTKELKFRYGTKANKQGIKLNQHNDGVGNLPIRKIAEDQALGKIVENGIVQDFANQIGKNLKRMTKTKYVVKL